MTTELLSRCVALQEEITRLKDTVVTLNANLKNPYGKNGQKSEDVLQEGFHFKAPWQKVTKMDNRIVKLEVSTEAFSSDLQTVSVNLAVNYHVDTAKSFSIVKNVGTNYEDVLITPSVNEVMKSIMARYTAEQSITNRNIISTALLYELNDKLSNSGIYVSDINIIDFDFSDVYVAAIESKQVAEQEKLRAKIEQEQLTMEKESESARRVIDAEAAAEVAKIEAEAAAYAGEKEAAANEKIAESLTQPLIEYYKIQQCRACPKVLTCDHKEMEMHGFLPIPEGGFNNPDIDIVAGVDVDGLYPTLPDELKQTLTRIMEERRYGVFG